MRIILQQGKACWENREKSLTGLLGRIHTCVLYVSELLASTCRRQGSLDVAVTASGFTKELEESFEEVRSETGKI